MPQTSIVGACRRLEWPGGRSLLQGEGHLARAAVEPPCLAFGGGQLLKQDPPNGTGRCDEQKEEEENGDLSFTQPLLSFL